MIQNLDQSPGQPQFECDLCIVGSGAAGITLAVELLDAGLKIVMLESGGVLDEPPTQALYDAVVEGHAFPGVHEGRLRTYGGSTTRWGGSGIPLDPIDFEKRDWVAESGWPIAHEEMRNYYPRASAFLATDVLNFDTDVFSLLRFEPPALDRERVGYRFEKFAPRPSLRDVYGARLRAAADLVVLLHANLTRIELTSTLDHVSYLHVRSLAGNVATVRARRVVICTGAIETARILLSNDAQQQGGIGNSRGLVGRYLQDHPVARVATIRTSDPNRLQHFFNTFYRGGQKYAVRHPASAQLQRRERILNAAGIVKFDAPADSPYRDLKEAVLAAKRGRIGFGLPRAMLRAAVHAPSILRPVYAYTFRGRAYTPAPSVWLAMTTEQEPNPQSRVTLADETDALGIRKSCINWRMTDLTLKTIAVYTRAMAQEFERLGLGTLNPEPWLNGGSDWRGAIGDQYHHMGTARMSESPERGVVDPHCRVHGIDNLYLAGSAVFPTSGQAGPTLTIIALAMRLADDLRESSALHCGT
ncbi:MAG: Choline dehydrogenase-like flavoprotein [Phycisphaerales bacterium]|nr:Choline dehydrogenase-like flavoprotein [Phycisphaerales bacterium]